MASRCLLVVTAVHLFMVTAARTSTDNLNEFERKQLKVVARLQERYRTNSSFAQQFEKNLRHTFDNDKHAFDCPIIPPSATVPTSVHKLTPGDIKLIAALGDSLTAGRGASGGILALLADNRGLSWSGGGDGSFEELKTLPNILRQYNPKLYGYATGSGKANKERAKLNVAVSGAKSDGILEQIKFLIERMKDSSHVDFDNDWKLVTLFIGANDLCDSCDDEEKHSVDTYISNIRQSLDYMHENMPRTFVNMVEVLNVEMVQDLGANILCDALHLYECACGAFPSSKGYTKLISIREGYQVATRDLVASGRYDDKDDFTVVLQPFYRNTYLPYTEEGEVDLSYFASDCFHYSMKGQQASAAALWNNMFEKCGSKRLDWSPGEPLLCPTKEFPYLYTTKNSFNISMATRVYN